MSCLLQSAQYTSDDVAGIELDKYNNELFNEARTETLAAIDKYQADNPGANLINMAKAKGLTDVIGTELETKFQTQD